MICVRWCPSVGCPVLGIVYCRHKIKVFREENDGIKFSEVLKV